MPTPAVRKPGSAWTELPRPVGVEPVGVSPAPPDFLKIADAYGIAAERLASAAGLADALRRGRAAKRPYLIEITVD